MSLITEPLQSIWQDQGPMAQTLGTHCPSVLALYAPHLNPSTALYPGVWWEALLPLQTLAWVG